MRADLEATSTAPHSRDLDPSRHGAHTALAGDPSHLDASAGGAHVDRLGLLDLDPARHRDRAERTHQTGHVHPARGGADHDVGAKWHADTHDVAGRLDRRLALGSFDPGAAVDDDIGALLGSDLDATADGRDPHQQRLGALDCGHAAERTGSRTVSTSGCGACLSSHLSVSWFVSQCGNGWWILLAFDQTFHYVAYRSMTTPAAAGLDEGDTMLRKILATSCLTLVSLGAAMPTIGGVVGSRHQYATRVRCGSERAASSTRRAARRACSRSSS